MLGGSGGILPQENCDKNSAIWCTLGFPKYVITILKINNFKFTKSTTTKFNCHIFSPTNIDVHAYLKLFDLELKRGVWGAIPPEAEEFLKNQTKWRLFLYFFAFWQGSLDPQNYKLAPQLP